MIIEIPFIQGYSLIIENNPSELSGYPTTRLQKGLILKHLDQKLDEEGVGFGVPVIKRGLLTFFSGEAEFEIETDGLLWIISASYTMNLTEKISKRNNKHLESKFVYFTKNLLAAVIRKVPITRKILTSASSGLRQLFNLTTIYVHSDFSDVIPVIYRIDPEKGIVWTELDSSKLNPGVTEIVIMYEQGARSFNEYGDTSRLILRDEEIGCWDQVIAEKAWLSSIQHHISFRLSQVDGPRLFRGREVEDSRLSWAGFGYSFSPTLNNFKIKMELIQNP